jgi:REP element-mobilizing transposase RayT
MARKLRLEFPGAIYHVISRGNYRQDIFGAEKTKAAFEACLFEACKKSGWVLHAFVIMSNHFHLALATPEGNLVTGMRWLLSTFCTRFNRYRNERGHVFQGRYQSLLVEEGAALGQVCHYIHLNPVRAGVRPVAELKTYRYSSYWYLWERQSRPPFLEVTTALSEAGDLADNRRGWQAYEQYLAWQAEAGPAGKSKAYVSLSRGWALGAQAFKKALVKDHQLAATAKAWESAGAREVREIQWQEALEASLRRLGIAPERIGADRKSAAWKVAIAVHLKRTTQAGNGWLAEHLGMGKPGSVSFYVSRARRAGRRAQIQQSIQKLERWGCP